MITDNRPFDTNVFFSGGAGMFIQYHDVIKPLYLYAVLRMVIMDEAYGLPIHFLKNMSISAIVEWYNMRTYINPLQSIDYNHHLSNAETTSMMKDILASDNSIYKLAPQLNVCKMFDVYRMQHMRFPIYVYSEEFDEGIQNDCSLILHGTNFRYIFGDLEACIKQCKQNFTYIFSDIELVQKSADILMGTCSHIILCRDYRYNYLDGMHTLKYDLTKMVKSHPFVRIGLSDAMNVKEISASIVGLMLQEFS